MFVYYFSGNFIFGFVLYIPVCMIIDRPINAFLNLKRDVRDAERHEDYKLIHYLDNFRPELVDGPDLASMTDQYAAKLRAV